MNKELFEEISRWQEQTFGQATPKSKIVHLEQEVKELFIAVKYGDSKDQRLEFADCFLLLFGAAASNGMSYEEIESCIREKFEINKARKWGKPDANGVVNHIKE